MPNSIEQEQWRVRRVIPSTPLEIGAFPLSKATPSGLSAITQSSIAPAAPTTKQPTYRPELPPLNSLKELGDYANQMPNLMLLVLQSLKKEEEENTIPLTLLFEAEVERDSALMKKIQQELKAVMAEHTQSSQNEEKWTAWQNVAQDVFFSLMIVSGVSSGIGTIPGSMMFFAGALGLLKQHGPQKAVLSCFTESQEAQKRIAARIEAGLSIASLFVSITATTSAIGGVVVGHATIDTVRKVIATTSMVLNASAQVKIASIKNQKAIAQAQIIRLRGEETLLEHNRQNNSFAIEELARFVADTFESIKRMIQNLEVSFS